MVSAIIRKDVIEDFARRVPNLGSLDEMRDLFSDALSQLGLRLFTYLTVPLPIVEDAPLPFFVSTFPLSWRARYRSANYLADDPIVAEGLKASLPFMWSGEDYKWAHSARQMKMFFEAADHGICHGLTIPLFSRGGHFALMTIADHRSFEVFSASMAEHQHTLHLLAIYFHEAAIIAAQPKDRRFKRRSLTHRELECLFWTAQGKTTWEISHILGITDNTFNFHIRNATRKMGVYSKHHAVVKAIKMGLIDPGYDMVPDQEKAAT